VGCVDLEVVKQGHGVGHLGLEPARRSAAPAVAPPVVEDAAIAGQHRLARQRPQHVGPEATVDDQHRVALPVYLVGQPDAVHSGSLHQNLLRLSASCSVAPAVGAG
jgi:hypothetical protein